MEADSRDGTASTTSTSFVEGDTINLQATILNQFRDLKGWYLGDNTTNPIGVTNPCSYILPVYISGDKTIIIKAYLKENIAPVDEIGDGTQTVWYNNSEKWELFFRDKGRIYLVYSNRNVVDAPILNSKDWKDLYDNKNIYYPTITGGVLTETHTHISDYLKDITRFPAISDWLKKYTTWINQDDNNVSDTANMAFTLFMLDQNVWKWGTLIPGENPTETSYYNSTYAEWVIGGPTVEMMLATKNTDENMSYYNSCYVLNENGYIIEGKITSNDNINVGTVWNHAWSNSQQHRYWICGGYFGNGDYSYYLSGERKKIDKSHSQAAWGYRPVVCLKDNVELINDDGTHGTTYMVSLK